MKKLVLIALVASFATTVFAQKSMVEANGCFDGACDTLDFSMSSTAEPDFGATANADTETRTIALNYNYLVTNNFGAGLLYRTVSSTVDGDVAATEADGQTIGVNLFWNFDGGWESAYAALRYNMISWNETDVAGGGNDEVDGTDIVLEYGKRMKMGKIFGLSLLYSPSVSYTMSTAEPGTALGTEDREGTSLALNPVNFSVAF